MSGLAFGIKRMFDTVDRLMHQGVRDRIFPGAVLRVFVKGEWVFHQAYGMANLFEQRPMSLDTVFDLASLTKPLGTTLGAMVLVQQGRMELDRACAEFFPLFSASDKARITPRHLLSHCSGLPAWRPYFFRLARMPAGERVRCLQQWILCEPLLASAGQRTEYSDLGFWVLQWLIEAITEKPLDRFLSDAIWRPLQIDRMFFIAPGARPPHGPFAATELCPWRNRLLIGEVHDHHAYALGGVAGHAGLFATAEAVGTLLQGLLDAEQGARAHALFERTVLQWFFEKQAHSTWALGFDTPTPGSSSAGSGFLDGSVGHLGFTGTSFWMDRKQAVIVVLLTNRVHPTRYADGIVRFRPRLHDAVMAAAGKLQG
jgi:serine-type D-Ala-D-Ala carboxypeptidase